MRFSTGYLSNLQIKDDSNTNKFYAFYLNLTGTAHINSRYADLVNGSYRVLGNPRC